MTIIISANQAKKQIATILKHIKHGEIFIYPTDTIYGIGCDATNKVAVKLIRQLKNRDTKPFSIIAPSKQWIIQNCVVTQEAKHWLKKLPGPYTLILKLKNKRCIASNVSQGQTIGVRIPKHWIAALVRNLKKPIVTTSANLSGEPFMKSLDDLNIKIKEGVSFIMYEGAKQARPSTIFDLSQSKPVIIKR